MGDRGDTAASVPLRDVLAGHTLRLGLLRFEQAMNPFVKDAMRHHFADRDASDPTADDADRARHTAVAARHQKHAADAARAARIRTVELPAARAQTAAAVAAATDAAAKKKAEYAFGVPKLTQELQALEGLAGFSPSITSPYMLVGLSKVAVMQAGQDAGLSGHEQQRLWRTVEAEAKEQKVSSRDDDDARY